MNSESKGRENWFTSLRKPAKDGVLGVDHMSLGSGQVLAVVVGAAPLSLHTWWPYYPNCHW